MNLVKRVAAVAATVSLVSLAACGGSSEGGANAGPRSTVDPGKASAVTPVSEKVVAAGEREGSVLLYSNADEQIMRPLVAAFSKKYPKIKVRTIDLKDAQIVERYKTEVATGTRTADIVMSSDQIGMQDFVKDGNVLDYEDPNVKNLPGYAHLAPGVVALSEDPVVALFNRSLLPESKQPKSMTEFAKLAPSLKGKIGTPDIDNAVGILATSSYLESAGEDGWKNLEAIGPNAGVESGTGNLAQKLLQGAYSAAFFAGGAIRPLITGDVAKVLNYAYLTDGTPLVPRAVAITAKAPHPNAAKVFVNYALSVEGQQKGCKGGFTPYRPGVKCPFGISAIEEAVGKDNVIVQGWDPELKAKSEGIRARWNKAFGR
jgi:iron(III) transport system substrate-binding protein